MQPPPYTPATSFTNLSAQSPTAQQPGNLLDLEFSDIQATLTALLANLKLIQRDDARLASNSVGIDQLSADVEMGFRSVTAWASGTGYILRDGAWQTNGLYRCIAPHTSGVFATDLAAGNWTLVLDLSAGVTEATAAAAAQVAIATTAAGTASAASVVSTAQAVISTNQATASAQSAADAAASAASIAAAAPVTSVNGHTGVVVLAAADVGLVKATAPEAQAGTEDTHYMTPAKTAAQQGSAVVIDKGTVSTGTVTFTAAGPYTVQRVQVGGALTFAFSGWPAAGTEAWQEVNIVNGGSAALTFPSGGAAGGWYKTDGTGALQASCPYTFQTSGNDKLLVCTSDGGTTLIYKAVR